MERSTYPWYVIRVRSNQERIAATYLEGRGYEAFLPSYKALRYWSDRKKEMDRVLFPGYVFCRLDARHRLPVLQAPGVVELLSFGKLPTPVPDEEIESIRTMVQSGLLVLPWPYLEVGSRVLVERGPLAGIEGILDEVKGKFRLVISVHLLQRSVSAEVDRNWVRPLPARRTDRNALAIPQSVRIA